MNVEKNGLDLARLTGLWALSEAGLGGILHLFHLPFTGILVAGFSTMCACLICIETEGRSAPLIKAWLIVMAIKLALSPQSPPTAYLAVSFQAFATLLCFKALPSQRAACLAAGALSLAESGAQRLLVLTLVFGNGFWQALDEFVKKTAGQFGFDGISSASYWLSMSYVGAHLIMGVVVGWQAGLLPKAIAEEKERLKGFDLSRFAESAGSENGPLLAQKPVRKKTVQLWAPLALIALGSAIIFFEISRTAGWALLRGGLVLALWHALLGRFAKRWLAGRLLGFSTENGAEIAAIAAALPSLQQSARAAWAASSGERGWRRLQRFVRALFALGLAQNQL